MAAHEQPADDATIAWQPGLVEQAARVARLGHSGATVWLTGLSAAGKTTIAERVEERLVAAGRIVCRLDGDNLRHGLNDDLGFDHASRVENVRRTAHVARLVAGAGAVALVALISPYRAGREQARALHAGVAFVEVWVDAPLALCVARDPRGLYARAQSGELAQFTGISDPYEPPRDPELVLRTGEESIGACVEAVLDVLRARGVIAV
jgi:bifunctional enzyme CysN/CysC